MFLPQLVALDDPAQVAEGAGAAAMAENIVVERGLCRGEGRRATPARIRLMVPPRRIRFRGRTCANREASNYIIL